MKKSYILILISLLMPILVFGADLRTGDQVSIPASENIKDDVYAGAGSIVSGSTIEGDLFAGGGTIFINGPVRGDLMVGGGTISILGDVGDDIRAGGGNILIQGAVGGDILLGGGTITISGSGVKGDLLAGGGLVQINSPIAGDVKIVGGEIFLNAPVGGNVKIDADKITLGPKAVISGNLTYKSPTEAKFESGSQVRGKIDFQKRVAKGKSFGAGILRFATFLKFLMLLTGALFAGLLFPRYAKELVSRTNENFLSNLGMGLVFLIVTPIAAIILLATVLGIPLGILALIGFAGAMIWGVLLSQILLGSLVYGWVKKSEELRSDWKIILLGAVLFAILSIIPIIGWIIQFGLLLVAIGTSIKMKWAIAQNWR